MRFVHVTTRTLDPEAAVRFYEALGLRRTRTVELERNRATLTYMSRPEDDFAIELVHNWDRDTPYEGGERFGHFAFEVDDIETAYRRLLAAGGSEVGRPPAPLEGRGHRIAFVADPDGNWVELVER